MKSRRRASRAARQGRLVRTVNCMVDGLNWLWYGGQKREIVIASPTKGQSVVLEHLLTLARDASRLNQFQHAGSSREEPGVDTTVDADLLDLKESFNDSNYKDFDDYVEEKKWRLLTVTEVDIPSEGAGSVDILDFLPPDMQEFYGTTQCIRDDIDWDTVRNFRFVSGVAVGEYLGLCSKLSAANMMVFLEEGEALVMNGQFGVKKTDITTRLIDDMRPANLVFKPPPPAGLPMPSDLGNIVVPLKSRVCFGKRDCRNFYHKFKLPKHLWPYFCWRPLWSTDVDLDGPRRLVYPARTTLPMGWSAAVYLGQAAHEGILYGGSSVKRQHSLMPNNPEAYFLKTEKPAHMVYVDDLVEIGLEQDVDMVKEDLKSADRAYEEAGTPSKRDKAIDPQVGESVPMTALGNDIEPRAVVQPAVERLSLIIQDTNRLVDGGRASPVRVRRLLGRWIACLLLTRPALSVLSRSFIFCHPNDRRVKPLPIKVKQELTVLVWLAPFLRVDLTLPLADSLLATDASLTGGGVAYRRMDDDLAGILNHREVRGWYTQLGMPGGPSRQLPAKYDCALEPTKWKTGVSFRWKHPDHINCLEMNAVVLGLKWVSRSPDRFSGSRFPFLIDSMVALGVAAKGRSSSARLNYYARQIAAYQFALNLRPYWTWVPTDVNPADEPSRR
eukprot:Lithocolla_globosa_v1_NODE_302_length_4591_cov_5.920414.p1 type:complete len:669 gc:universal NODE_302_length_4591_cov_5.920414:2346-340(-)